MKNTIIDITKDGQYIFENIYGKILKVYFKSNSPLSNVEVTLVTAESETIYKTKLDNEIVLLYPYNFVDVQGRGDNYYSFGSVGLTVEGLVDGQIIERVSIFYEEKEKVYKPNLL